MNESTALLTDRYELTMLDAALADGTAKTPCLFELFSRRLPSGRRYGVVAGVGRFLEGLAAFRFGDDELSWLSDNHVVSDATLAFLADYRFTGTAFGYREGDLYFPHSPILTLETDFAHGVILETYALSVYNYDSAVASAASRMVSVAGGRPIAEMGSRRANEWAAVAGTRAAYLAGFSSSSNLEAGRQYDIPTMGTAAHAFTLLHETEQDAFRSQIAAMGTGTTLLVDTFDIDKGVRNAIAVAGPELGSVRIDSGDLVPTVTAVRNLLDSLGATSTKITVTNDLDEYSIAALAASPVDSFGVGTSVLTGGGAPTCGMVYKLTSRQTESGRWIPVQKTSAGKAHFGGRKTAMRRLNSRGIAEAEMIGVDRGVSDGSADRNLLTVLATNGEPVEAFVGSTGLVNAREFHRQAMAELPAQGRRLTRGDAAIPTVFEH